MYQLPGGCTLGRAAAWSCGQDKRFEGITLAMEPGDEAAARIPQRDERVVLIHGPGRIVPSGPTTFSRGESSYLPLTLQFFCSFCYGFLPGPAPGARRFTAQRAPPRPPVLPLLRRDS